jgi:hypothetical protein
MNGKVQSDKIVYEPPAIRAAFLPNANEHLYPMRLKHASGCSPANCFRGICALRARGASRVAWAANICRVCPRSRGSTCYRSLKP